MPIDPTTGFPITPDSRQADTTADLRRRLEALERGSGGLFVGQVIAHARASAPARWLPCQGGAYSRADYAALFDAIGTQYGIGDGSTTFNVPNIKGSTIVGVDTGQAEFDTRGETGGAKTHTLSASESGVNGSGSTTSSGSHNTGNQSADHSHAVNGAGNTVVRAGFGGVAAGIQVGGASFVHDNFSTGGASANHTHAVQNHSHPLTARTADSAHNNLQPYIALHYAIFAGA